MIKNSSDSTKTFVYRAPLIYAGLFYLILLAWTVFCVSIMGAKGWINWVQLFMVAFIFVMTWYFSLGISYKVEINDDGKLELTSFRRVIRIHSTKIADSGGSSPTPRIHPVSAGTGKGLPLRYPQKQGPSAGPVRHSQNKPGYQVQKHKTG